MKERTLKPDTSKLKRRAFLAGSGTSIVSFGIVKPQSVFAAAANEKVKLGLIGAGGRGTWISRLFMKHGGYTLAAVSDYFEDRVNRYGDLFDVPAANRFTGMSSYKRLLDKGIVDAVAIESPPYFHPEQAAAGVEAGVHVYTAKPIAVDVPGCLLMEASGKKASKNNLCYLIDFQTRANEFFIEAIKRVRNGAIGEFAFGQSSYHAGNPWSRQVQYMKDDPKNIENRLRAWGLDRILSGDIITEQNIHTLDVASWIMNRPPVQASGSYGYKVRNDGGNCRDSFMVVFQYPDNVGISFSSRQFEGHGTSGGIKNRMYGSQGVLETEYGGGVLIRGENAYKGSNTKNIFTEGVENNISTFHNNIMNNDCENPTVAPSVRSNLVTILGRTAAYTDEIVRWDDMLERKEKLEMDFTGLKD